MRYLGTGASYSSLETTFGISKSLISKIIPETCHAIIKALKEHIQVQVQVYGNA